MKRSRRCQPLRHVALCGPLCLALLLWPLGCASVTITFKESTQPVMLGPVKSLPAGRDTLAEPAPRVPLNAYNETYAQVIVSPFGLSYSAQTGTASQSWQLNEVAEFGPAAQAQVTSIDCGAWLSSSLVYASQRYCGVNLELQPSRPRSAL